MTFFSLTVASSAGVAAAAGGAEAAPTSVSPTASAAAAPAMEAPFNMSRRLVPVVAGLSVFGDSVSSCSGCICSPLSDGGCSSKGSLSGKDDTEGAQVADRIAGITAPAHLVLRLLQMAADLLAAGGAALADEDQLGFDRLALSRP